MATVLMVAEKPSLAASLAKILSKGTSQERAIRPTAVHEYNGRFRGADARFLFTSVTGHVMSIDFEKEYNNWDKVDPVQLFDAPTQKSETRSGMRRHLQQEAREASYLVLWLDCDKEGENICFEVIDAVKGVMKRPRSRTDKDQTIYRAKFSAITDKDINAAMANLGSPDENASLSVDARQELDLRMGCAFTRFQTHYFQGKYGDLDASLISYGPCQTPTLGFCVDRHDKILGFKPEKYWVVEVKVECKGRRMNLSWDRGRVFDQTIGAMFLRSIQHLGTAAVTDVTQKEKTRSRPCALNTVEMMRSCSAGLGMGPHHAMQVAERLYIQGYISYPRTETTAYPENFDLAGAVQIQTRSPIWGREAQQLLREGINRPKSGKDVGDHPPITPLRNTSELELGGGDAWRVYDLVARHFLATLSKDKKYLATKIRWQIGAEGFTSTGTKVISPGFTVFMHWLADDADERSPDVCTRDEYPIEGGLRLGERQTTPPGYLTESELITLMEKHAIGTDASIPVHINNICERNYVRIASGRTLVPTNLGIVLVRGYYKIDPELVLPKMRSAVEGQLDLIAAGKADYLQVVRWGREIFRAKFEHFEKRIGGMDELFEATFTPLAATGKPISKCAKCLRYMKYIASKPARLYCHTCDETFSLPNNGKITHYKGGVKCPLDGYELLLFSTGSKGAAYPLCPYCYNNPPFGGPAKAMGCNSCTHPTCQHSMAQHGICSCMECEGGTLVLDPNSAPTWKMACNTCNVVIKLFEDKAHHIVVVDRVCVCGSKILTISFNKNKSPLADGATDITGCLFCDETLAGMVTLNHAVKRHPMHSRRRGRGGRGRGGRGRGRGAPKGKMAQLENYFV